MEIYTCLFLVDNRIKFYILFLFVLKCLLTKNICDSFKLIFFYKNKDSITLLMILKKYNIMDIIISK
jgi:hypothetical protein